MLDLSDSAEEIGEERPLIDMDKNFFKNKTGEGKQPLKRSPK